MNRPTNKQIGWGIVAAAAILATLFFGVNYPVPPAPEPGLGNLDGVLDEMESRSLSRPVQLRDVRILQDLAVGGDVTVADDLTVTDDITADDLTVDDISAGDVTLSGGLTVTGGVTGTNVLTTGDQTVAGVKTFSTAIAVGAVTGPVTLTGPTAVATATPAAVVNNLGAANNSFEVRDAATPVFVIGQAGVGSITGALTMSGGYTANDAGYVNAPTAIATATPAFMVNSAGVSNIFEVRDAATPVAQWYNGGGGNMTGNWDIAGTLQYGANNLYPVGFATSGQQVVYGTSTITGTLAAPHGLTTVTFCNATLGEDPETGAGDAATVTVAVSANVCTLKAWQDDWSAATETDVVVHWLVIGAP